MAAYGQALKNDQARMRIKKVAAAALFTVGMCDFWFAIPEATSDAYCSPSVPYPPPWAAMGARCVSIHEGDGQWCVDNTIAQTCPGTFNK